MLSKCRWDSVFAFDLATRNITRLHSTMPFVMPVGMRKRKRERESRPQELLKLNAINDSRIEDA